MIKAEMHTCGRLVYVDEIAPGLTVRTDTEPLDSSRALEALMGGVNLWRATSLSAGRLHHLTGATPAALGALRGAEPPTVVAEHRCDAREAVQAGLWRPQGASPVPQGAEGPRRPSAGRTGTPSPERQTAHNPAQAARQTDTPSDSAPTCENCRTAIRPDQPHAAIQVGDLYVWAAHTLDCQSRTTGI